MRFIVGLALVLIVACKADPAPPATPVGIGGHVANFTLKDPAGRTFTLTEALGPDRAVLVSFWSSRCPCSAACEEELAAISRDFAPRATVVAVASDVEDTPEIVARAVREKKFPFRVLLDPGGHVADLLGAEATPTSVVIDGAGTLRFRGDLERIAPREGDVELGGIVLREVAADTAPAPPEQAKYGRMALEDVLAKRPVRTPSTPTGGCRITRERVP